MKKIILIFCLILLLNRLYAQTYIENMNNYSPPSPEAASLITKDNNYSIDYYKGKLNYTVPLLQESISGFNFNVGLQYSTGGFKVQDLPGSVGLGWNLTAGGVITRYIEGLPDEDGNGYCGQNQIGGRTYGNLDDNYFKKVTSGEWDSQPDKFFFSFLGISGTFRLTTNGEPVLESSMGGLKIEYSPFNRGNGRMNGGAEEWIIKDQKGNRYYFGGEFVERSTSRINKRGGGTTDRTFISSWFIKRVITANNKFIDFDYIKGSSIDYTYYVNVKTLVLTSNTCSTVNPEYYGNENVTVTVNTPLYLSKISSDKSATKINFLYNQNREDLSNGKILTDVNLQYNNIDKKIFSLSYGYFLSTDGSGAKRLKLIGIKEVSSTGNLNQPYQFFYNETAVLPARNSIKTDYWGYYNDNPGNSNVEGYLNCSKAPIFFNTKACILEKVINKTGGVMRFEYEQNKYRNGNNDLDGGGLRIKRKYEKIKDDISLDEILKEEYSYLDESSQFSSGQIYLPQQNRELKFQLTTFYGFGGTVIPCVVLVSYKYSEPLISIFDLNETSVGYSKVSINRLNGSTKYSFTNFSDKQDELEEGEYGEGNAVFANTRPQFPSTSYAFVRGKIKSEQLFDLSGQKVKSSTYDYEYTDPLSIIIGIKAFPMGILGDKVKYNYGRYKYFNQDYKFKKKPIHYLNREKVLI